MKIIIEATPAEVVQLITSLEGEKRDSLQVGTLIPKDLLRPLIKKLKASAKQTESVNAGEK